MRGETQVHGENIPYVEANLQWGFDGREAVLKGEVNLGDEFRPYVAEVQVKKVGAIDFLAAGMRSEFSWLYVNALMGPSFGFSEVWYGRSEFGDPVVVMRNRQGDQKLYRAGDIPSREALPAEV